MRKTGKIQDTMRVYYQNLEIGRFIFVVPEFWFILFSLESIRDDAKLVKYLPELRKKTHHREYFYEGEELWGCKWDCIWLIKKGDSHKIPLGCNNSLDLMAEEVEEKEQIWDVTGFDKQSFFGQNFSVLGKLSCFHYWIMPLVCT